MPEPARGASALTERAEEPVRSDREAVEVALAQSGDARAFERLYRAHVVRVHSLVRRMAPDQDSEELVQDVFVRAWQKLGTFRGEAAFGTWLHRLAVNVLLGRRGALGLQRRRFAADDAPLAEVPAARSRPDVALDLEVAMRELPEGARRVFVLHDVEGYRHEEIATMLGITAGTSKSQLHRARMALRERLVR